MATFITEQTLKAQRGRTRIATLSFSSDLYRRRWSNKARVPLPPRNRIVQEDTLDMLKHSRCTSSLSVLAI